MAKIDIITLSGFTASDGSIVASGATIKFDAVFKIGTTTVLIRPQLYRNRELFETGFGNVDAPIIPNEFALVNISEEEYYVLTPLNLYERVRDYLNTNLGGDYFELEIITD